MKIAIIGTFIVNTLFAHLCMMPMAYAASMPMPHDEAMEMTMSPIEPMSPAHCKHCARVAKEQPSPMSTSCAGHCLSKGKDAIATFVFDAQSILSEAALPPSLPVIVASADEGQSFAETNAPPVNSPHTRTVVLLE